MTTLDLDALERAARAATPGEWYQTGQPWYSTGSGVLCGSPDGNIAFMVADCEAWEGERDEYRENDPLWTVADADADAAFIALANPATILSLISDCRALQERVEGAEKVLRSDWHGVYLDGRNEHGSHVIRLPQRSIELDQDEQGDFLKTLAETVLSEAEALGFSVGDAVVLSFERCCDEGFFSHYEYAGVSPELTALLYGTPEEQAAARTKAGEPHAEQGGGEA